MSNLNDIKDFVKRYHHVAERKEPFSAALFVAGFHRLDIELKPLLFAARERFRQAAPEFNIFRVLRLAHKEVITHSPLLSNLLYPTGTHAQGSLFLQSFLNHLHEVLNIDDFLYTLADTTWQMRTESVTEFGNLDIVLWSPNQDARIVIENKIGAADQPDQLGRYWRWMQQYRCKTQRLFYLTPTGRRSTEPYSEGIPYVVLSYRDNIRAFIESALFDVQAPRLREILAQYLELLTAM